MIKFFGAIAWATTVIIFPATANATVVGTNLGHVTFVASGWHDAWLRVQLDIPQINPDNCPYSDGYMVNPAEGGSQLFTSQLMSGFTNNYHIRLVIDGCTSGRPNIISVESQP